MSVNQHTLFTICPQPAIALFGHSAPTMSQAHQRASVRIVDEIAILSQLVGKKSKTIVPQISMLGFLLNCVREFVQPTNRLVWYFRP